MDSRRLYTAAAVSVFILVPHSAIAHVARAGPRGAHAAVGEHSAQHGGQRGGRGGAGPVDGRGGAPGPGTAIVSAPPAPTAVRTGPARGRPSARRLPVAVALASSPSQDKGDAVGSEAGPPRSIPTVPVESSSIRPLQPSSLPQTPLTPRGALRVEIGPASAQLYVDGFYVGTVEESNRSAAGLSLPTGWHRLEVRAPGFVTPAINVTIEANRTASYRGELMPLR